MTIRLKCWPESWDAIARGEKTAEVRTTEDRTFSVGDVLELQRWNPVKGADDGGILGIQITHIDSLAGDANIVGVRLANPATNRGGTFVNLVVLSFRVLGVVRDPRFPSSWGGGETA